MSSSLPAANNEYPEDFVRDFLKKILNYKEALFSMAQVLTLDQEKSLQLVEKTVVRALSESHSRHIDLNDRRYLLQLLLEVHQSQTNQQPALFAHDAAVEPVTQQSIKGQLVQDALKGVMPMAFASLDDSERALLILCEVERLSCTDASLIMGSDSRAVCNQLDEIKQQLTAIIQQNISPTLSQFLSELPQDSWLPAALQTALKANYKPTPSTLESRIRTVVSKKADRKPVALFTKERPATATTKPTPVRELLFRRIVTLILILSAGLAGYIGSEMLRTPPNPDLIALTTKQAKRVKPILSTTDLNEAQDFINSHLDWRLSLPVITGSEIEGVGISEIASGVRVPVFVYKNNEQDKNDRVTLYAFTYALLDQFQSQIQLPPDILDAIAEPDYIDFQEQRSGDNVFVWRNANDIFLAVANEEELNTRIQSQ